MKLLKDYNDLAESYEKLRQHMDAETKFNQEQTSQNAAVMAEMQESISLLQSQLAQARRSASSEVGTAVKSQYILNMEPVIS